MSVEADRPTVKPLEWVGSSKTDLVDFPQAVRKEMGHALYLAQSGDKPDNAKPLRGFGGANVLELVANHDGNTYRGVYTVKFPEAIYVLHCFEKKSKKGIATPRPQLDLIKQRLKVAAAHYQEHYGK